MLYRIPTSPYLQSDDSTQQQLPLDDVQAQDELAFTEAESNPTLTKNIKTYEEAVLEDPTIAS